jgi:hypothetical protein
MYRKVHNTMLAFSATGVLLLVGLMAGAPTMPTRTAHVVRTLAIGPVLLRLESPATPAADLKARNIDARIHALEAQLERSASAAETVSHTAAFAANLVAHATIADALAKDADPVVVAQDDLDSDADERQNQRRHVRRARAALALPYFSFAQGLRRNRS